MSNERVMEMVDESSAGSARSTEEEPFRYGADERRSSFALEDEEWRTQWRDWLILGAMIVVSLAYHLVIFALQPGLR